MPFFSGLVSTAFSGAGPYSANLSGDPSFDAHIPELEKSKDSGGKYFSIRSSE